MKPISEIIAIYFIAGTQDCPNQDFLNVVETALKNGVTCFQYREKGAGSLQKPEERLAMAAACQKLCQTYQVPLIINDDLAIALALDADGIHVGQTDRPIEAVLDLFPEKIVGLSCYDEAEVAQANALSGISYYGIGPVFGTTSKADAKPPIGPEKLQTLTKAARKPVVAIGGISTTNRQELRQSGIAGVAVISALTQTKMIPQAIQQLKK